MFSSNYSSTTPKFVPPKKSKFASVRSSSPIQETSVIEKMSSLGLGGARRSSQRNTTPSSNIGASASERLQRNIDITEQKVDRIGSCEKCYYRTKMFSVQFLNIMGFILGMLFISFTIYLFVLLGRTNFMNITIGWIGWCTGVLGVLYTLNTCMSAIALCCSCCRWCAVPASYLSLLLFIYCLAMGVASSIEQQPVFNYLNAKGISELNMTHEEIATVKTWYSFIITAFYIMSFVELFRYILTVNLREQVLRIDNELDTLLPT